MKYTTHELRVIVRTLAAGAALVATAPFVVIARAQQAHAQTANVQQTHVIKLDSTNSRLSTKIKSGSKSPSRASLIAPSSTGVQKGASKTKQAPPSIIMSPNAIAPSKPQVRASKGADTKRPDSTLQSPPAVQRSPRVAKPQRN